MNSKKEFKTRPQLIIVLTAFSGLILIILANTLTSIGVSDIVLNVVSSLGIGLISAALVNWFLEMIWKDIRMETTKAEVEPILAEMEKVSSKFEALEGRLAAFKQVGLNHCHGDRNQSLPRFYNMAKECIEKQKNNSNPITVNIVASSASGLIGLLDQPENTRQIQKHWRTLVNENGKNFRILLTHPAYSHLRQPAEERISGDIEVEILQSALYFYFISNMNEEHVRFYRGSPTVFMIQIDKDVLINPYPYGKMAMNTVSLEFNGDSENSFITQFAESHFSHTWKFIDRSDKNIDGKPFIEGIENLTAIYDALRECTYLGKQVLRLKKGQVERLDTFIEKTIKPQLKKVNENIKIKEIEDFGKIVKRLEKDGYKFSQEGGFE